MPETKLGIMKKLNALLTIVVLIFFSSCNPKISSKLSKTYPPLDYRQEVIVIGLDQAESENAEEF
jgi:hypothetical protein